MSIAGAALPTPAHATETKCRNVIVSATASYTSARINALTKCWDQVTVRKIAGPCPDVRATASIQKARAKLVQSIDKACGGADKVCGASSAPDVPLATIGWNIGNCSTLGVSACDRVIGDCSAIGSCVSCISDSTVDQAFGLFYDPDVVTAGNPSLRPCLRAIGKHSALFLSRIVRQLSDCWVGVSKADSGGSFSCPAATSIGASRKKAKKICKQCGGPSKVCGGSDDVAPIDTGFPATCPPVGSCAGPVQTLLDLERCGDCVTSFLADGAVRATLPAFASPQPQCQQAPFSLTLPR